MKKGPFGAVLGVMLFVISLIIPAFPAFAEIEISNMKDYYVIGDKIAPALVITPEVDVPALLSAELVCEEFSIVYFMQPLELEKGKAEIIDIAPFRTFNRTAGTCIIDFYLNTFLGGGLEKEWTNSFEVGEEKRAEAEPETEENATEEQEELTQEEILEGFIEEKESPGKWLYLLFLIILGAAAYVYWKKHFSSRSRRFNKGWKL